jgi:hypothetical protein
MNKSKQKDNEAFNLVCPICKEIMVPWRNECEDGSGWSCGYMCECTPEMRDEYFDKLGDKYFSEIEKSKHPEDIETTRIMREKEGWHRVMNDGTTNHYITEESPLSGKERIV